MVASWLNTSGAVNSLILAGRSGAGAASKVVKSMLTSNDAVIHIVMADAACQEDAAGLLSTTFLKGQDAAASILHSGGVLSDSTLVNQHPGGIRKVFAPKTTAAQLARRYLGTQPLATEVLFSSVASLLGSPGQVNYSAANALLDAMSQQAQCAGTSSTSIQWGAWAGAGMAAQDHTTALRVERLGMGMVQPTQGLKVLERALSAPFSTPVVTAVPFLWGKFLDRLGGTVPPMFAGFGGAAEQQPSAAATPARVETVLASKMLLEKLRGKQARDGAGNRRNASDDTRNRKTMQQQVHTEVSTVAGTILGKHVPANEPLMAAGLDSLSSVEFRNSLESKLGLQLPSTLVFDYPTIDAIAQLIAKEQQPVEDSLSAASAAVNTGQVRAEVSAVAKGILGAEVDVSAPLMSAGLDSLSSVEFRNSLESKLGLQLPSTLVFDYPTVDAISQRSP